LFFDCISPRHDFGSPQDPNASWWSAGVLARQSGHQGGVQKLAEIVGAYTTTEVVILSDRNEP